MASLCRVNRACGHTIGLQEHLAAVISIEVRLIRMSGLYGSENAEPGANPSREV